MHSPSGQLHAQCADNSNNNTDPSLITHSGCVLTSTTSKTLLTTTTTTTTAQQTSTNTQFYIAIAGSLAPNQLRVDGTMTALEATTMPNNPLLANGTNCARLRPFPSPCTLLACLPRALHAYGLPSEALFRIVGARALLGYPSASLAKLKPAFSPSLSLSRRQ